MDNTPKPPVVKYPQLRYVDFVATLAVRLAFISAVCWVIVWLWTSIAGMVS